MAESDDSSSSPQEPLNYFGWFVTRKLRDRAINHFDGLLRGHWKAPSLQPLQKALRDLPDPVKVLALAACISAIDTAMHGFLFAVQEQADFENRLAITVDGNDVAGLSDGIHGEQFGPDGWFATYSAYGEPPDQTS